MTIIRIVYWGLKNNRQCKIFEGTVGELNYFISNKINVKIKKL